MNLRIAALAALALLATPATAKVAEPKKLAAMSGLKAGEGAVRLSIRTQRQYIDTLHVYFVRVDDSGADTGDIVEIDRGAGVPIMGSNMIDPKPLVYRLPAGRYRLMSYTIKCTEVPRADGICTTSGFAFGNGLPADYYEPGSPEFTVAPGTLTDAGDFVAEYTAEIGTGTEDIFKLAEPRAYAIRWRPLAAPVPAAFASAPRGPAIAVSPDYRSRLTCEVRPSGASLYVPFKC